MAAHNWILKNIDIANIARVLSTVRLSQMTLEHLLNFVQPSGMVDQVVLSQVSIEIQNTFKLSLKDTRNCKYADFNYVFI